MRIAEAGGPNPGNSSPPARVPPVSRFLGTGAECLRLKKPARLQIISSHLEHNRLIASFSIGPAQRETSVHASIGPAENRSQVSQFPLTTLFSYICT